MSLNYSEKIKESAFYHVMSNYIKAYNEFKQFEKDYDNGEYDDSDSEQSDNLWDYYQSRVNMFLYLKNLVNKNTD